MGHLALETQEWNIVIADYSMPHFTAPASLKVMQLNGVDLPLIIVSRQISEEIAVEAMKTGAHDYVMKDNMARLNPAVERELREAMVRRARLVKEEEECQMKEQLEQRVRELTVVEHAVPEASAGAPRGRSGVPRTAGETTEAVGRAAEDRSGGRRPCGACLCTTDPRPLG